MRHLQPAIEDKKPLPKWAYIPALIGVLLLLYFICLVVPICLYILLIYIPICLALVIISVPIYFLVSLFKPKTPFSELGDERWEMLRQLFIGVPAVIGALSPAYTFFWVIHQYWNELPISFFDHTKILPWADKGIGFCGLAFITVCVFTAIPTLRRQVQQIENLPTSKTRSAAIGLAEFIGVARPVEDIKQRKSKIATDELESSLKGLPEDYILISGKRQSKGHEDSFHETIWNTFYLEDETGKILVDPRGVAISKEPGCLFFEQARKIVLTKDRPEVFEDIHVTQTLLPGDPVYLIGSVEINHHAPANATDSERLVVKPSSKVTPDKLMLRLLLGKSKDEPGKEIWDIFFLSDTTEAKAKSMLLSKIKQFWMMSLVWFCSSLLLIFAFPAGTGDKNFVLGNEGIVLDTNTGLEWYVGPDKKMDWNDAKSWVEGLNLDGGGWRMPTIQEIRSLYIKGEGDRNMTPLLKTTGWFVWSSEKGETKDWSLVYAWCFNFYGGKKYKCNRNDVTNPTRVFAVRSRK